MLNAPLDPKGRLLPTGRKNAQCSNLNAQCSMLNVSFVYPVFFYTPLYICPTSSLNREVGL